MTIYYPYKRNGSEEQKRNRHVAKAINRRIINENSVCEECEMTYEEVKLTIDHIIPVVVMKELKIDFYSDDDNFRILCRTCNRKKRDQLDFKDERTKKLLIKYLT